MMTSFIGFKRVWRHSR